MAINEDGLVYSILQSLARLELGLLGRRNFDGFASARITSFGRLALNDRKGTESNKTDFAIFLQTLGDDFQDGINGTCGIRFGDVDIIGYGRNQFILVHEGPLLIGYESG